MYAEIRAGIGLVAEKTHLSFLFLDGLLQDLNLHRLFSSLLLELGELRLQV